MKVFIVLVLLLLILAVRDSSCLFPGFMKIQDVSFISLLFSSPLTMIEGNTVCLMRPNWERLIVNAGGTGVVSRYVIPETYREQKFQANIVSPELWRNVVIKESYPSTIEKIRKECQVLQSLHSISNIERCLCTFEENHRVLSVLSPYFNEKESPVYPSLAEIVNAIPDIDRQKLLQLKENFIDTVFKIIENNLVLSDVQVLIQPFWQPTPRLVMIDFSEARQINSRDPTESDLQSLQAFLLEVKTLISTPALDDIPPTSFLSLFKREIEDKDYYAPVVKSLIHRIMLNEW